MSATFFAALLYLPQFMQKHLGYSPLEAGVGILPFLATFALVSFVAGPLYNRVGAKPLAVARRRPASPSRRSSSPRSTPARATAPWLPGMVVLGIGIGSFYPTATTAGVTSVDESQSSLAGGILYMFQIAGGSIGLGLTTTVFSAQVPPFVDGIQAAFRLDAALSLVGFLVALLVRRRHGCLRSRRRRERPEAPGTATPRVPAALVQRERLAALGRAGRCRVPPQQHVVARGRRGAMSSPATADSGRRCRGRRSRSSALPADQAVVAGAADQLVRPRRRRAARRCPSRRASSPGSGRPSRRDLVVAAVGVDFEAGDRRCRADQLVGIAFAGWCRPSRPTSSGTIESIT